MKKNGFLKLVVLSVFFVQMGIGTITPAIASIAAAFPDVPFTTLLLVSTLPTLVSVPATVIAGRLAGSTVKYKTLLVFGMILFVAGGIAPYFVQSFGFILFLRAIFGLGLGIVTPLGGALIISFFNGEVRAQMMGLGNVVANVGGMLFQLLGGMAAAQMWGYSFLVHALGIITLVLVLFMPEPEKAPAPKAGEAAPKMPTVVYGYSIAIMFVMVLNYPLLVNMSTVLETTGMGDATVAALVLTMFTIGGMVSGVIFAKIFGLLKQNTLAFGLFCLAIAMACMSFGNSLFFMYAAATLGGIGFSFILPTMMMSVGNVVHPSQVATASGFIIGAMNIGGFLSAYFFDVLRTIFNNNDIRFSFYVAMICFTVGAIGYIFIKPKSAVANPEV